METRDAKKLKDLERPAHTPDAEPIPVNLQLELFGAKAWDVSGTFDYMPSQYITFRWEYNYRSASVPYFTGSGGVTPPGGNQGAPGSTVTGFTPDLRRAENLLNMSVLVKF